MPTHITVNGLGLTYKGSIGLSIATIPDVCKTPSPGGPIPLPYPNIATQSTLKSGTTTVLAKGGKMIAVKGSQYGMSSGDEPGTVGGVKSNVFKKATDWITYSFDVKMDGKNACRHTDKKFHNDKNTVNLAGDVDPLIPAPDARAILQKACCECDDEVKPGPYDSCATLGEKKHTCCEAKLTTQHGVGGERGYNRDGTPFTNGPRARVPGETYGDFRGRIHGTCWPDACALDTNGNPCKFYDFKFGCEKDVPIWVSRQTGAKGPLASGMSRPDIGPKQNRKYRALASRLDMQDTEPEAISNKDC
ncbi:DUF4150 domain-containing protein [Mesorhizobium sp. M0621]|uniref:DUF4150 domain-containing protein n=1 Tax=Mesorhizobium sp. M0621 TaxID=2956974 RepID=UPI0033377BBC